MLQEGLHALPADEMTTVISTGSATSGADPILPLAEEPDKHKIVDSVKKRLDEELTSVI